MRHLIIISAMAGVTLLTACDNALNETDYTYSISSETF